jgi:hypothetical protein
MRNPTWSWGLLLSAVPWACSANEHSDRNEGARSGSSGSAGSNGGGKFSNAPTGTTATPAATVPGAGTPSMQGDSCDVVHLHTSPSTPDMLIVLDRSGSMGAEGRWVPSGDQRVHYDRALLPSTDSDDACVRAGMDACTEDLDCVPLMLCTAGQCTNP